MNSPIGNFTVIRPSLKLHFRNLRLVWDIYVTIIKLWRYDVLLNIYFNCGGFGGTGGALVLLI